ncbi:coiled-coil domain-containing protein 157-like [Rhopilema esculentum]|uniref:coiled-coil domain-containing protein 157-like n=1 Tax=Rhopilema esculentum TaxID=499914 RepID=UPI0031D3EFB0
MAHLLGSKSCLESLARDIEDIQVTIKDGVEKVGPLHVYSWKFPDKLSGELDVKELLSTYTHSSDDDFNRLAHIVLFELVIDRFMFLMQIASQFLDKICSAVEKAPESANRSRSRMSGTSMSMGLTVKKFWNKATHLSHKIFQMQQQAKDKRVVASRVENAVNKLQEDNEIMREAILSMRTQSASTVDRSQSSMTLRSDTSISQQNAKSLSFISNNGATSEQEITLAIEDFAVSKMLTNVATQTFDTAFVSCEACARMQQNLIDVGTAMISLCESQGLPSSLAKQKKMLKKSLMAATDVSRWTIEQNRDIERINKHLEYLYSRIEPLRTDLEKSRQTCKKLKEQVKELSDGKIGIEKDLVEKEVNFNKKISVLANQHEKSESKLKKELEQLKTDKEQVDCLYDKLESENKSRKKQNMQLEKENAKISAELKQETSEKKRLLDIEQEFHLIKDELTKVHEKLCETEVEMGKTQTENKALAKHNKAIQAKQDSLLERANQLDQECEDLQNKLAEMEEEREELIKECEANKQENEMAAKTTSELQVLVNQKEKQKEELEMEVKNLQEKVAVLEEEIQDARKHLTLLSEFPVIGHSSGRDVSSSVEDIIATKTMTELSLKDEMSKQIKANTIRIAVLEEQNNSLRNSLAKYEQCRAELPKEIPKDRVPLWENGEIPHIETDKANHASSSRTRLSAKTVFEPVSSSYSTEWVAIEPSSPKPPSQPRTATSKLNEKRQTYTSSSASGGHKSRGNSNHSQSRWSDVAVVAKGQATIGKRGSAQQRTLGDSYEPADVYSCPDCDKMYSNQRDLQIHKSFCYANL